MAVNDDEARKLAEEAFNAGADLESWLEKSGRPSDYPGYDEFDEWWSQRQQNKDERRGSE